jgi:xylulokinase
MYVLGIDLGTSSVKVSVVELSTAKTIVTVQYPESERAIISLEPGWAEQNPEQWWNDVQQAILKANTPHLYNHKHIQAIGIAYQMHGLVLIDIQCQPLRNSIIWCDSRAVPYGDAALNALGNKFCLTHLLNFPGNFTAAKLAWVEDNDPHIFNQIHRVLLPGDYLALKFTGHATTTESALSEGIFWDFKEKQISNALLQYYNFNK